MKFLSSFTHSHVVPNPYDFISSTEPKGQCNYNEQRLRFSSTSKWWQTFNFKLYLTQNVSLKWPYSKYEQNKLGQ